MTIISIANVHFDSPQMAVLYLHCTGSIPNPNPNLYPYSNPNFSFNPSPSPNPNSKHTMVSTTSPLPSVIPYKYHFYHHLTGHRSCRSHMEFDSRISPR